MENTGAKILFNYQGPWSAEFFKLLGQDVKPYEGMARLLDESRCTGVMDAVEALNAGVMHAEDGYCLGWSETWGQYYLLFQKDKQQVAMDALARTQQEIEAAQKVSRRKRLQKVVADAMHNVQRSKWQEALDTRQQSMEERIKAAVRGELETGYADKAKEEVASKSAQLRQEAQVHMDQATKKVEEISKQKAVMEADLTNQLSALSRKVNVQEVKDGDHGDLPKLYLEIVEVQGDAAKLKTGVEALRDHAREEGNDLQEALAHCDALVNNPETLPGLHQLVDVLQRCQKRHQDAEKLTVGLGLKGGNNCLGDLRSMMGQAAVRCAKICEQRGKAQFNRSLETEIESFQKELKQASKGFLQLQIGFQMWCSRLGEAIDFVEQAKICCDVREEEFPELAEYARYKSPKRKQEMWERMVRSVVEHSPKNDKTPKLQATQVDADPRLRAMLNPRKRATLKPQHGAHRHGQGQEVDVGDLVAFVGDRRLTGYVRFIGETQFAVGEWLGIELTTPHGKNDGSVNGVRYFICKAGFGLFLRRTSVELLPQRQGGEFGKTSSMNSTASAGSGGGQFSPPQSPSRARQARQQFGPRSLTGFPR